MALSDVEQLEQFQKRAEQLTQRRNRVQAQLMAAREQYNETKREAEAEYKTSDVNALKAQLASLEAENAKIVTECARAMDEFEAFISRIENALANPQLLAAMALEMEGQPVVQETAAEAVAAPATPAAVVTPAATNTAEMLSMFDTEDL